MSRIYVDSDYEAANIAITLGLIKRLREVIASFLASRQCLSYAIDLGAGNGVMTLYAVKKARRPLNAVLVDPSIEGLKRARRVLDADAIVGIAEALPLRDGSAQVVYTAFALRQFEDKVKSLLEVRRVLKRGGAFVVLDFWRPRSRVLDVLLRLYMHIAVPLIAMAVAPRVFREFAKMRHTLDGIGDMEWLKELLNLTVGRVVIWRVIHGIFIVGIIVKAL